MENALYQVEDAARELSSYRDRAEYNPGRLEPVEERLDRIKRLKKSMETVYLMCWITWILPARKCITWKTWKKSWKMPKSIWLIWKLPTTRLRQLSAARRKAAKQLEEAAIRELSSLELGRTVFRLGFLN